jgi:hypothetical protein
MLRDLTVGSEPECVEAELEEVVVNLESREWPPVLELAP